MGALSPMHLAVVLIIALLVFGPKKLPEIGRGLGQAIREFKKASREMMDSFQNGAEEQPIASPALSPYTPTAALPERVHLEEPDAGEAQTAHTAPAGTVATNSPAASATPALPASAAVREPEPSA